MAQHDSLIGTVVGNYEIQRELGRGGMGVVYKANEMSLQRVVALKVLPTHLAADEEFVKRFDREARAAARLNHPNIVTVYAVGEHDGMHFMAMEYVKGKTIADLTKEKGRFEPREAMELVAQAADALGEAHDHDIIHRDIKPQNVMVDRVGRVKVMDFGLAKVLSGMSALTATGAAMGTPTYMAPEQCKGEAIDPRTDIYALGVLLFEMLTGRPPYVGDTPMAVISQIMMAPFPPITEHNPNVPPAIVAMLAKMTAKEPAKRYASGQMLLADIKRWRRTGEVSAPGDDEATTPLGEEVTLPLTPTTPANAPQSDQAASEAPTMATPVTGAPGSGAHTPGAPAPDAKPKRVVPAMIAVALLLLCALAAAGGIIGWRMLRPALDTDAPIGQTAAVPAATEPEPQAASQTPEVPSVQAAVSESPPPDAPETSQTAVPQPPPAPAPEPSDTATQAAEQQEPSPAPAEQSTEEQATPSEHPQASEETTSDASQPSEPDSDIPSPEQEPPQASAQPPAPPAPTEDEPLSPAEPEAPPSPAPDVPVPDTPETQLAALPEQPAAPPKPQPAPPEPPSGPKEYAGGRFIDRGDGTVLDDETLLIWQKADSGKPLGLPRPGRSSDYRHYADQLDLAGRAWRIPTKAEFMSLDVDLFEPRELPFENSGDGHYWCFGSGPKAMYWVFDWNTASFGVSTPDLNPKCTVRCVAGP